MLKQWKSDFMKAENRSMALERRMRRIRQEHLRIENEMLEWSKAQTAPRENILTGTY